MIPPFPSRWNFTDPDWLSVALALERLVRYAVPLIRRKWPAIRSFLVTKGDKAGIHFLVGWGAFYMGVLLIYTIIGNFLGLSYPQLDIAIITASATGFLGLSMIIGNFALRAARARVMRKK